MNSDKIKVLIIEDDEDDFIIFKHYLTKIKTVYYDVYWSSDYDFAVDDILKDDHDIYLVDHYLGKGEGVEIIEKVREKGVIKPLILLTGASDYSVDEKAMSKGASDFIVKTAVKVETLERSLRYAMERYHHERFIKQQEKKYRSLFELSMQPLVILDQAFSIVEFNNAFQSKFVPFGKNPINQNFNDFFKYDFDFNELSQNAFNKGFVNSFKSTLVSGANDFTVILSLAKLSSPDPKKINYQVAIQDITELMRAQFELQRMEKLSVTSRVSRMLAHEVRNPLTNINLALEEIMSVLKEDPEVKSYGDMIGRNSKRIADLIDDLLKSTRPAELELTQAELPAIIEKAIDFCADRMKLKEVKLMKDFPTKEITGKWDPEKLKIAFVNIIINAIEAMADTSQPKLIIRLTEENETLVITIEDNGKGMDQETTHQIFDPFFSDRKNGMGLGMTATMNIINMHRGNIDVQSKPNKGTRFVITLGA